MDKDIIIVDDIIPISLQEKYKEWLLQGSFPWYYTSDITTTDNLQFRPSMGHKIYDNGSKISSLEVDCLAHIGAAKFGWQFNGIVHAKTLLQFPLNQELLGNEQDNFHVDMDPCYPHLVVLYYVMDADGDTMISNIKHDGNMPMTLPYHEAAVVQRVTPKQGRAVLFDGSRYHTAGQPQQGMRCVINMNVY